MKMVRLWFQPIAEAGLCEGDWTLISGIVTILFLWHVDGGRDEGWIPF